MQVLQNENKVMRQVGIFVPDLSNLFYTEVTNQLVELLRKKHFLPVIFTTLGKNSLEKKYYQLSIDHEFKACIFLGGAKLLNEVDIDIPVVLIDRDTMKNKKYPVVTSDNEHGGSVAAQYLIDNGAKKIIIIKSSNKGRNEKRRIEGFVKVLDNNNLKYDVIEYSENEVLKLISSGSNAVFAYNDYKAVEVINLLKRHDIKIPKKVQVIGYDNNDLGTRIYPSLTTVTRQTDLMAKEVVRIINDMVIRNKFANEYVKVEDFLIVRESTK